MILNFTEEDIEKKINIVEVEDIIIYGETIEVMEEYYLIKGKAEIDGEIYKNFVVEFTLAETPSEHTCKSILDVDWEEYDFIFNN